MLVLTRKRGEEIVIGNDVRVVVVSVRGDKVRLGFSAPAEVPVHRKEVHDQIQLGAPTCNAAESPIPLATLSSGTSRDPVLAPSESSACL